MLGRVLHETLHGIKSYNWTNEKLGGRFFLELHAMHFLENFVFHLGNPLPSIYEQIFKTCYYYYYHYYYYYYYYYY